MNAPSPPPPPTDDRLQALEAQVVQLSEAAQSNHSAMVALIALAQALINSHPAPTALFHAFLDQIDVMGSALPAEKAEHYRRDVQTINRMILEAVNRQAQQSGD